MDIFITFGCQYPREPHPVLPEADANGYIRITAGRQLLSHEALRQGVFDWIGQKWAFDYPEPPEAQWVPKGELGVLDARTGIFIAANGDVRHLRRADGRKHAGHFGDCPTPEVLIPLNCAHCQSRAPYPASGPAVPDVETSG